MSIYLSKLLPELVYPLGLALILLIISIFLIRRNRLQVAVILAAILLLWLGSNHWTAMGLARSLEWQYFPPAVVPRADIIILLGGGTEAHEFPRPLVELNGAGDRVLYAAALYKQGAAPRILVSGGSFEKPAPQSSPAEEAHQVLLMLGVPSEAMWLETESRNTHENAVNSWEMLAPMGLNKVLLVTSASHMPRAVPLFREQGFEVTPMPTDYLVTRAGWHQLSQPDLFQQIMNLTPSAGDLAVTTRILKEYLGMFYYGLKGWL